MKIVKPLRLGVMSRPYVMRGRARLGVSVLALASLGDTALLQPEADLWALVGEMLGEDGVLDLGVPKPCAEFLVSGSAYTAHQPQRNACVARVRVGSLQKSLMVMGDRYWLDRRATEPLPFDAMPLDWRHAYGGPSYADNPRGRGAEEEIVNGVRTRRLPNIEPLDGRMTRPDQQPEPAGFGPVSPMWPRRFRRAGEYHDSWLDNGARGFLDTLDPHFFNAAPPDQWWPGQPEFAPGVDYEIWNMHPKHARLAGVLPDWRARCFLRHAESQALRALDLGLTTAWLFPDRDRVVLIYQGATDLAEDDGADIDLLMPALDPPDAMRPPSHYEAVLARRLDPDYGPLHVLLDDELLPEASLGPWESLDSWNPMSSPLNRNQRARAASMRQRMRDEARAAGLDASAFDVPEPPEFATPSLRELPGLARQARHAAEEARIDMLHARRELARQLQAEAGNMPPGMTPALLLDGAQAGAGPGGPPTLYGHPGLATLQELAAAQPLGQGNAALDGASMRAMMARADGQLREMYLRSAHLQPAAEAARPARAARLRRRVQALLAGSRDLSGLDLTGADLSGLDLSGARCVGTWFECADLSGARLDGADLTRAVLARARAEAGSWRDVTLRHANLGSATLADTSLSGAHIAHCELAGIRLQRCDLSGLVMQDCHLPGAELAGCRFDGAVFDTVTFWQQARLTDLAFTHVRMARVSWVDCVLDGVAYESAELLRCSWVQVACDTPVDWTRARLTTCCVVLTDLDEAVFAEATLHESSLRNIGLAGADFTGARLQRCDLSGADLRDAILAGARADESLFIRASLAGADLSDADLKNALLHKADLTQADLRDANLFRADLAQARLDRSTDTCGAYVHLANTRPAARPSA